MRHYKSNDGKSYNACNSSALVRQLYNESQSFDLPRSEWREEAAERATDATGQRVRGDSDAHFVHDLIEAGLIKETEE